MERLMAEARSRVLGAWRTSLAGAALLVLMLLVGLGPARLAWLHDSLQGVSAVLGDLVGLWGTVAGCAGSAALLAYRGNGGCR